MKTINDLVNELGVSRQRIQYIIKQLPSEYRPQKKGRNYIITDEIENEIKKHIEDIHDKNIVNDLNSSNLNKESLNDNKNSNDNNKKDNEHSVIDLLTQIDLLNNELLDVKNQLEKETNTVHSMQKLLDQSQQLQLIAQNKLDKIETKKQKLTDNSENYDSKTFNNKDCLVEKKEKKKNKHWWNFLSK